MFERLGGPAQARQTGKGLEGVWGEVADGGRPWEEVQGWGGEGSPESQVSGGFGAGKLNKANRLAKAKKKTFSELWEGWSQVKSKKPRVQ